MTKEEFKNLKVDDHFIIYNDSGRNVICKASGDDGFKIVHAPWEVCPDKIHNSYMVCDDRKTELLPLYNSPLYLAMNEKE